MCGGDQKGPWSAWVDAETGIWHWLGPGNTNMGPGWVVPGIAPSRYTTLPVPHLLHPPRVPTYRT